jgi:hypothetical protein
MTGETSSLAASGVEAGTMAMIKPADKKLTERKRRYDRLAAELRSNLLKRKAQTRGQMQADASREVRPAGNRPQDT